MPAISMLIKPASSLCNLRCRYCFYHDEAAKRSVRSYGIMGLDTLEIIIKRAMEEASGEVTFAFQGGEPTIAGLDFFQALIDFVGRYQQKNLKVHYAIQTNGIYPEGETKKWAEFFAKHRFLIGLSFDGTREVHDYNRIDAGGNGTAAKVIAAAELFRKCGADFNILTVVNAQTARHIAKIYAFYKKQGWTYMQFIPCLEPLANDGGETAEKNPWTLDGQAWLSCNSRLFDLWYEDNFKNIAAGKELAVSVRHLDDYLRMAAGMRPESCGQLGVCSIQNVIEADGGVYPCDFYVLDDYKLGNIRDMSFRQLYESKEAQDFMIGSSRHSLKCRQCRWYGLCRGGCARMKTNVGSEYIYCDAAQKFYEYTWGRIRNLSDLLLQRQRGY